MRIYDWELWGNYGNRWDLLTTEATRKEISAREREYRANESGVVYKIKSVRVGK